MPVGLPYGIVKAWKGAISLKQIFDLSQLKPSLGTYTDGGNGHFMLGCGPLGSARAQIDGPAGSAGGVDWKKWSYLCVDLYSEEAPFASPVLNFEFWSQGNASDQPDITLRLTCLPRTKTRMVLELSALDAQRIFLERTPGRFRGFVTGIAVDPGKITRVALGLREYWSAQKVWIENAFVCDEVPEIPNQWDPQVDELGQWNVRDWDGKTAGMDEMIARLQAQLADSKEELSFPEGYSAYGGWKKKRFAATGFFRVEKDAHRYWLVDPDGYAFYSTGLDGAGPHIGSPYKGIESLYSWLPEPEGKFKDAYRATQWNPTGPLRYTVDFLIVNFIRAFGDKWMDAWVRITKTLLSRWGFNTLGARSPLSDLPAPKLPYCHQLTGYPSTADMVYRDFPDVFSPEFEESARQYAAQMTERLDDRYMIGYFMRNEPTWGFAEDLEIAEELLANPNPKLVSKKTFIKFLMERYSGDISAFNRAWNLALTGFDGLYAPLAGARRLSEAAAKDVNDFSYVMIREYLRVPALACKAVDPNHLNLGLRYAFILYPNQLAGKEFLDVFSINCYKIDPGAVLQHATDLAQMPVIIGEFHFGSIDKGLGSTGIIGVATQRDRALAYQRYLEACAVNPLCVGAHWFTLYDQSCMGREDGENYQIGLLDICNHPYEEFIDGILHTHGRLYQVASGELAAEAVQPVPAKSNIAS